MPLPAEHPLRERQLTDTERDDVLHKLEAERAELAAAQLAYAEVTLAGLAPWRLLRRHALQRTVRASRQLLADRGIGLPDKPTEREQRRARRTETRRRRRLMLRRHARRHAGRYGSGVGAGAVVAFFVTLGIVSDDTPTVAERAADAREVLELVARNQERWAISHDGQYTDDRKDLVAIEEGDNGAYYAYSKLTTYQEKLHIVLREEGYDVTLVDDMRFSLRRDGRRLTGYCQEPAALGCKAGQWKPAPTATPR